MPKKPIKWGKRYGSLPTPVTGYLYSFDVYTSADLAIPKYPKGLAYHVVMKLVEPLLGKHSPVLFEAKDTSATRTMCKKSKLKNIPKISLCFTRTYQRNM